MLTELQVKGAKPKDKRYMLRDDKGLYLRVDTSGNKYWILRYWEQKKERQISLGPYPDLSLKDARIKRDEIQTARAKGESPIAIIGHSPQVFADVVAEWLKVRMCDRAESYVRTVRIRLNRYILPKIGATPLKQITSAEVLQICRSIENLGHDETARRVKTLIGQVYSFAIAAGYAESNPTAALQGALKPKRHIHYATITNPSEIAILMKAMKAYPYTVMRCAMLFSVYTFARPGEIRAAEWLEIKNDVWDIPAGKMKMKRRHIVPLSTQWLEDTQLYVYNGDKHMNSLQVFTYDNNEIRTLLIDGEAWLVAKDVCDVLELTNSRMAVQELDDDEKGSVRITDGTSPKGGNSNMTVINEPVLYKLTFKSRKLAVKKFTRWVTHEVLPTLRRAGSYSITEDKPAVIQEDTKPVLPAHSGTLKAAGKVINKAFKCKEESDFLEVIALDTAFKEIFGRSALEIGGLKLVKKFQLIHKYFISKDDLRSCCVHRSNKLVYRFVHTDSQEGNDDEEWEEVHEYINE